MVLLLQPLPRRPVCWTTGLHLGRIRVPLGDPGFTLKSSSMSALVRILRFSTSSVTRSALNPPVGPAGVGAQKWLDVEGLEPPSRAPAVH